MKLAQEQIVFNYSLGVAISYWAYVEMDLRHLVTSAVSLESNHLVSVGYFSIENFRSKLAFVDNIVTERFHKSPAFSRWTECKELARSLSVRRNKLAHRTVMVYAKARPGRRYALIDWPAEEFTAPSKASAQRRGFSPPSDAICVREIVKYQYEFEALMRKLQNVRAELNNSTIGRENKSETAKPVPRLETLWSEIETLINRQDEK